MYRAGLTNWRKHKASTGWRSERRKVVKNKDSGLNR